MAHVHQGIDFVIGVYIVYRGKVLLVRHKKLRKWLPIGGHVELDEDPEQALFREIKEECGLRVKVMGSRRPKIIFPGFKSLLAPRYLNIHRISNSHRHIGMMYFATAKTDKVTLAVKEHDEIRWFSKRELAKLENVPPDVRHFAKTAFTIVRTEK